jgi:hypothetical protein
MSVFWVLTLFFQGCYAVYHISGYILHGYDERKINEMHFQSKPYIENINLAPTCFGAAGAPSLGAQKILMKLCVCYVISAE